MDGLLVGVRQGASQVLRLRTAQRGLRGPEGGEPTPGRSKGHGPLAGVRAALTCSQPLSASGCPASSVPLSSKPPEDQSQPASALPRPSRTQGSGPPTARHSVCELWDGELASCRLATKIITGQCVRRTGIAMATNDRDEVPSGGVCRFVHPRCECGGRGLAVKQPCQRSVAMGGMGSSAINDGR